MDELIKMLNKMERPVEGFNILNYNDKWWGIGKNGEIVYGIDSTGNNVNPMVQATKLMKVYIATEFICMINDKMCKKKLSIYVLKNSDDRVVKSFFRICNSFGNNVTEQLLLSTFYDFKELFSNEKKLSSIELQGMYGEFFAMYFLKKEYNLDIAKYYHKESNRKFDFSISNKKRIEVKTTLQPKRIHHFLHLQLDIERSDIKIISMLLQKDDQGMSLMELIEKCKELFFDNLNINIYIEMMIKNMDEHELETIMYNTGYLEDNFKVFNGIDVPKIKEKNTDGVYNVEYDVDLSNVKEISIKDFKNWILE